MDDDNGDSVEDKHSGWRLALGALVVIAGVTAVVFASCIVLEKLKPDAPPAAASSSSDKGATDTKAKTPKQPQATIEAGDAVAVLTPVLAAIVGVVGLYFGISATGSARGREAEGRRRLAQAQADTAKVLRVESQEIERERRRFRGQ